MCEIHLANWAPPRGCEAVIHDAIQINWLCVPMLADGYLWHAGFGHFLKLRLSFFLPVRSTQAGLVFCWWPSMLFWDRAFPLLQDLRTLVSIDLHLFCLYVQFSSCAFFIHTINHKFSNKGSTINDLVGGGGKWWHEFIFMMGKLIFWLYG